MNTLRLIIFREWFTRVRRKAFILGTILVPILMAGFAGFVVWMEQSNHEHAKVLVADASGLVSRWDEKYETWVPICPECFPERSNLEYRFADEALDDASFLASEFDLMVLFDDAILMHQTAKYFYEKSPAVSTQSDIERDLSAAIERFKVKEELALDYEAYKRLKTKVKLVGEDVVTRDGNATGRSLIGFVFSLILFMQILVYGMHVMRGVIEEKANRIVEVVISVVKPVELMIGKIIGIGLVGMTQFLALALLGWLVFMVGGQFLESTGLLGTSSNAEIPLDFETWVAGQSTLSFLFDVNWPLMVGCALVYFVLGFAMYASLFAAIGAAVDQESDAQYLMLPAMIPLLAAYLVAAMAIENPEGDLAFWSSFVPFTAPIVMLIRVPLGVLWWELCISMAGVAGTAYLMIRLSGRVFRMGILMHGKKLGARELFRWMKYRD